MQRHMFSQMHHFIIIPLGCYLKLSLPCGCTAASFLISLSNLVERLFDVTCEVPPGHNNSVQMELMDHITGTSRRRTCFNFYGHLL